MKRIKQNLFEVMEAAFQGQIPYKIKHVVGYGIYIVFFLALFWLIGPPLLRLAVKQHNAVYHHDMNSNR